MTNISESLVHNLQLPKEYINMAKELCADGKRKILAIAGAPGSGKSTVAKLLHQALPECSVLVPMDGFHLSNQELERLGRKEKKGAPDTFDVWGYKNLLKRLTHQEQGEIVYAPEFYRTLEEPIAGVIPVREDTPLIITEGNYLLLSQGVWGSFIPLFSQSWFITAPVKERQQRLIDRHCYFGRSLQEATDWVEHTDEPNARLIEQHKENADVVINWGNSKA